MRRAALETLTLYDGMTIMTCSVVDPARFAARASPSLACSAAIRSDPSLDRPAGAPMAR
jgi:hypothetical protein